MLCKYRRSDERHRVIRPFGRLAELPGGYNRLVVRAILFDLDGTLHDRQRSVSGLARSQHERFPGLQAVEAGRWLERFLHLDARGYVPKAEVYPALLAELGLPGSLARPLIEDYWARYNDFALGFAGLEEVLGALRGQGYRLGVVTNGSTRMQTGKLRALGIEGYFEGVIVSEAVGAGKPQARIYEAALERVGAAAAQTVFVGDHPENDVAGPQRLGMRAVWFRDDYWGAPERPDAVIEGLEALPGLIARWNSPA